MVAAAAHYMLVVYTSFLLKKSIEKERTTDLSYSFLCIIIIVVVVVPRGIFSLYVEGILQSVVSPTEQWLRFFFFLFLIYTSIDHIPDPRSVSPREGGNSS